MPTAVRRCPMSDVRCRALSVTLERRHEHFNAKVVRFKVDVFVYVHRHCGYNIGVNNDPKSNSRSALAVRSNLYAVSVRINNNQNVLSCLKHDAAANIVNNRRRIDVDCVRISARFMHVHTARPSLTHSHDVLLLLLANAASSCPRIYTCPECSVNIYNRFPIRFAVHCSA